MTLLPQPRPGIMNISPYAAGKSKAGTARRIIKLSSNENPLGPSPKGVQAFSEHATELHRYPDPASAALREALAQAHGLDTAHIVCGNGSDELIGLITHAYAGQGDEVLFSQHGFAMYRIYAQGAGATPVAAKEQNLTADVDALIKAVTRRTKLLFLANPNNPTGTYLPAAEVTRLRGSLREDVILVLDAAYAEYAEKEDYSVGNELVARGNTVVLRTFSKLYGLAALRLGWGYFPAAIVQVINRVRGPFNVSAAAQAAGIAALGDMEYIARARAHNRQWLPWMEDELKALGLVTYPSLGNFVLAEFPGKARTAEAANRFLLERGIILREMNGYGLPDMLRISIGTGEENGLLISGLRDFFS